MNYFASSALINAITSLTLGGIVFFNSKKRDVALTYSLQCFSLFIWSFFYFFWQTASSPEQAIFYCKALMMGAIFIPTLWFHNILCLLNCKKEFNFFLWGGYVVSVLLSFLNFSDWLVAGIEPRLDFKFWPIPGPFLHVQFLMIGFYITLILYVLYREYIKTSGLKREQIRYLFVATAIAFAGGLTNYLLWYKIPIKPYGNITTSIYAVIIAYAILKNNLMEIKLAIRYSLIYILFGLVISLPVILIGQFVSLNVLLILCVFIFFLIPILFKKIENPLKNLIDNLPMFHQYKGHNQRLQKIKDNIWNSTSAENACKNTAEALYEFLGVESCAIILLDRSSDLYFCRYGKGIAATDYYLFELNKHSGAYRYFIETHQPMIRELMEQKSQLSGELVFNVEDIVHIDTKKMTDLEWLKCLDFEIAYPVFAQKELLAIIALRHKKNGNMYNDQDLIDIDIISETFSGCLRMFDRDLNQKQLTLSWVHDLIRPFGPKGLVFPYLEKMINNSNLDAETQEMAQYMFSDLQFSARYLSQLFSADKVGVSNYHIESTSIVDLFKSIELRFKNKIPKGVFFVVKKPSVELKAYFDFLLTERRVVDNFLENALRYVHESDSIILESKIEKEFVRIDVKNTGSFISEQDCSKIFDTGFQKKNSRGQQGLGGFGLANAKKVALDQGGQIGVESSQTLEDGKVIESVVFWFTLPMFKK